MKIYPKTRKSHRWNEDRFIVGKDYFVVIDGATPLKKSGQFNEARWMVDYLKKNFKRYSGDIKYRLQRLCEDAYNDLPVKLSDEDYLPTASACWAELSQKKIKIGILGDCEVTAVTKDGKIIRFYDDKLEGLDKKAIDEMVSVAKEKNLRIEEARKFIQETLIRHRKLANKKDGYFVLSLSPSVQINEKSYEIDAENVKTLYLYSDGFSQAFTNLKIYPDHREMFEKIEGLDAEIKKIVDVSFGDEKLDKYPRFKKIDDVTVVKIDF